MSYGIGSFMSGMANGAATAMMLDDRLRQQELNEKLLTRLEGGGAPPLGASPATSATTLPTFARGATDAARAAASSSEGGMPYKTTDPVASDMAPHQRALLNAIAGGESGGRYDVRYTPKGGVSFSDFSKHPGIMEPGPHGLSSAAGRYQFTRSTWDGLGGGDFSPENQDRRAWQLASDRYKSATGGDLDADLQKSGLTNSMMETLTPTWQAFKSNRNRHTATYRDSMSRYQQGGVANASPAAGAAPATRSVLPSAAARDGGAFSIFRNLFPLSRGIFEG